MDSDYWRLINSVQSTQPETFFQKSEKGKGDIDTDETCLAASTGAC
jgi:hypothetical protein